MTTRRLPPRYPRALALEPRILLDAAATATAEAVVTQTETKPGVTAKGADATISIKATDVKQSVDLFSGVSVATDTSNQELSSLTISVNTTGSNQALVIDGTTIALQAGNGVTTNNAYTYAVTVNGSSTTVTLSIASSYAYSSADVATLIDSIQYSTLDNTVETHNVTVTLGSLSDSGGESADLSAIHSSIAVTSDINVAPTLSRDDTLHTGESYSVDDLGSSASEVVYSSDGTHAYVAGTQSISVFSIDSTGRLTQTQTLTGITDMGTATHMVISADGKSIYTTSGSGTIVQFSVASDGTVSYSASIATNNGNATGGLAISQDGAYVYVGTQYNGVVILSRDSSSGALTALTSRAESSSRNAIVATSSNYVYTLSTTGSHTLTVYSRNSDGTLSTVATVASGSSGYNAVDYVIQTSSDGQYIYVGDPANGTISTYHLSGTSLQLASTTTLSGFTSLALSSDGSVLYASTSSGGTDVYSVSSSGGLTLQGAVASSTNGSDIALSADGKSLLVAGGSLSRYTTLQDMSLGVALAFAGGLTLRDSNYDALANGAGNYKGASITVTTSVSDGSYGSYGFADGGSLTLSNGVISQNGTAIATLSTSAGVLTVTFIGDATTAVANQVLHQLTYFNASAAVGSLVQLSATSADAELSSNTVLLTLRASTSPLLNTDAATGYSLSTATSETVYSYTLLADLFKDADGDRLTWSISGLPEGLTFDASTRTISGSTTQVGTFSVTVTATDASGASASLVLALAVDKIANRAPEVSADAPSTLNSATQNTAYNITLDSTLFSDTDSVYGDHLTWTVSGLPDGLTFNATTLTISGTSSVVGNYKVTVTATDQSGATAAVEMTLRVISEAEANNNAPSLVADASILSYTSDGSLNGFSQYVNSITLSEDGGTLIIAASTSNNGNGTSYLYIYGRDTTNGELTLLQTFTQGTQSDGDATNGIELDGLAGITSVAYSSDGSRLYLSGYDSTGGTNAYSVSVFSIGDDGLLTLTGQVADIPEKVLQIAVAQDSRSFYALSATTIYAYRTGDDGTLTQISSYTPGSGFGTAITMQIDDSGIVYVLSGGRLTIYTATDDGSLAYAGQLVRSGTTLNWTDASGNVATAGTVAANAFTDSNAFAVSSSGFIYLTTSNGFLTSLHYDSSTNTLSMVSAFGVTSNFGGQYPHGIAISDDGTTLYVVSAASSVISVYTIGEDGVPIYSSTIATSGAMSRLVVSNDGQYVYGGRNLYFGTPLLSIVRATSATVPYSEAGTIHPVSGITLSDADYDALNNGAGNYNGASITLTRSTGANTSDTYGFADTNGLTLADGIISLNGNAIATFTSVSGLLTVTFTADVSTATANLVAKQLTYTNTSKDPGSSISMTLSVADQYAASSVTLLLSVSTVNDAPTLTSSNAAVTYSAGGNAIKVFDDTAVSAIEADQTVTSLTLTVAGLADGASETLSLNGTSVALTDGTSVTGTLDFTDGAATTTYSYTAQVTVSGNIATVTITSTGIPSAAAAALVDSIGYADTSSATVGTRTITLTAIKDSGGTGNGGVDTTALNIASTINVILDNTAPTLSATGNTTSYVENAAGVTLFSDVTLTTGETGQAVASLTLSVTGVADGSSETLTVDGTTISLVAGTGTTSHGYSYTVTVEGSTATLVIASSSGMTVNSATALVADMTYSNSSEDPTAGNRNVTLTSVQDDGGTGNAGTDSTTLAIVATIDVVAVNDAPTLQASAQTVAYSTSGSSVTLFSDVVLSAVESGQAISTVTFTVTGVVDNSNETLTVDGTRVSLVAGTGTTSHYSYRVTVSGDTATVVITSTSGMAADSAATLIEQTTYANLSNTQTAGVRSISVSVQDNGGTVDGGSDSSTLSTSATLTVVGNSAPVLSANADYNHLAVSESLTQISGLDDIAASALSSDGSYVYVISSSGTVAVFSRNISSGELLLLSTLDSGVNSASQLVLSRDGSKAYVLGNDGNSIAVLTRDSSDGSLTPSQILSTQNVVDLAVASNGSALYVVDGNYSGLLVYTLDSSTQQYALSQSIAASTGAGPYLFSAVDVETVGDYVYVVTDPVATSVANTLIVYHIGSDGQLSAVGYLRDGQTVEEATVDMSSPVDVAVSTDGSVIYVASSTGVAVFTFDASAGTLSYLGALSNLANVTDIALSSDNGTLYLTSAEGGVSRYKVDGATLTLLDSIDSNNDSTLAGAKAVVSAANGTVIVVGSNGLVSLTDSLADELPISYTEQHSAQLADMLTLSDADYDAMAGGVGNYNGAVITLMREGGASNDDTYSLAEGNGLTLINGVIYLNSSAIASFSNNAGVLTLTFTSDVSSTIANAVLKQISYTNTNDDPATTVRLTLAVTDGYDVRTSTTLVLGVTAINDAPTLNTTTANATYTEGDGATSLFSDTTLSTVESGQAISALTLTVSGLGDGASETLNIDGAAISLVAGSGTTTSGYHYTVTLDGSVATVTINSDDGIAASNAAALINSLTYANSSRSPTEGSRAITLTGVQDNGGTANGGDDTSVLTQTVTVTVIAVNDAPILTSNPSSPAYIEGGDAVGLFSDTDISTVEDGQSITALTLTVAGVSDGSAETLTVDGTSIALVNGSGTTSSGYAYSVSLSNGVATLVITSSTGIATADANQLVNSLTYADTGHDVSAGTRTITLASLQDSGGNQTSSPDISAVVNVAAANDAPTLTAVGSRTDYVAGGTSVPLFSDAQVSTLENQQAIAALTLSVTGITDSAEALEIDGSRVTLANGNTITTASGLHIAVKVVDGRATVSITSSVGLSVQNAQSLINTMNYVNDSPVISVGTRTVTLNAVRDNGGDANGGVDTTVLDITATVSVINSAPEPSTADATLASATKEVAYSTTLTSSLFSDINGDTLSWAVQGLPEGLSFDPQSHTLSGKVSTVGSFSFTVTVTDSAGASASRVLTLNVLSTSARPTVLIDQRNSLQASSPHLPAFAERAFDSPAFASLDAIQAPIPTIENDNSSRYAIRLLPDQDVLNPTTSLTEQLVQTDDVYNNSLAREDGSDFVRVGDMLVGQVEPAVDGSQTMTLKVPAHLPDGSNVTRISLDNGLPLPNWVRFNPRTGQLQIDRSHLARQGSLNLTVIGRDTEGKESRTALQVRSDQRPAGEPRTSSKPASQREHAEPSVPAQLRQAAPSALLDDARHLLEQLSGLNDQAAPVRTTA